MKEGLEGECGACEGEETWGIHLEAAIARRLVA